MGKTKQFWIGVALVLVGLGVSAGQGFQVNGFVLLFWALAAIVFIFVFLHDPPQKPTSGGLLEQRAASGGLFPIYSFGGEQNQYWYPDGDSDDTIEWRDSSAGREVEIEWSHVPDDVDVLAKITGEVRDLSIVTPEGAAADLGYGMFRVWNVSDAVVAVTSGRYDKSDSAHQFQLRIPRSNGSKVYRLQMMTHGKSTMVSITGEAVFKRSS